MGVIRTLLEPIFLEAETAIWLTVLQAKLCTRSVAQEPNMEGRRSLYSLSGFQQHAAGRSTLHRSRNNYHLPEQLSCTVLQTKVRTHCVAQESNVGGCGGANPLPGCEQRSGPAAVGRSQGGVAGALANR
jgi:hypothetical protein